MVARLLVKFWVIKQGRYSIIAGTYSNRWSTFSSYSIPFSWGQSQTTHVLSITGLDFTLNGAALGISLTVPNYTGIAARFIVKILNQTVLYKLDVNCLSVYKNLGTYYSQYGNLNCQFLSKGQGYRSQNYSMPILDARPYYNFDNSSLRATVFLNSFLVFNPDGEYMYLSFAMSFNKTHYTITFSTSDKNIVTYIGFCLVSTDLSYVRNYMYYSWTTMGYLQCPNAASANHGSCPGYPGGWSGGVAFSSEHRQFWGMSGFNFTKNQQPINWYLNTSSFTDLTVGYVQSSGIESIQLSLFVNAYRSCINLIDPNTSLLVITYFDPSTLTCTPDCSTTPYPYTYPAAALCIGCCYQCQTCINYLCNSCSSCNTANNRYSVANGVAYYCPCSLGYVDVGAPECKRCDLYMPGCAACNLYNNCLLCNPGLQQSSDRTRCVCIDQTQQFTREGQCISIDGCLSSLNGTSGQRLCIECDISKNLYLDQFKCSCLPGYVIDQNQSVLACIESCGDKIITINEQCDDGNVLSGDGCDNKCFIESGYDCYSNYTDASFCILNFTSMMYYETLKIIDDENTAEIYLIFQPYMRKYLNYQSVFRSFFDNSLENDNRFSNITYQFENYQNKEIRFQIRFKYLQKVNETEQHYVRLFIQDTNRSHFLTQTLQFTLKSKNYPLYLDEQAASTIKTFSYVLLGGVIFGYLIFFISILSEGWIGIELMNTLQWLYFYLFLLDNIEGSLAYYIKYIKLSIGYNKIVDEASPYDHYLYHDQLLRFGYVKEFFLNFNFPALLFVVPLLLILVKKIADWRRKKKVRREKAFTKQKKKQNDGERKESFTLSEWIVSKNILSLEFILGRLFLPFVLVNFFQTIFSFFIQISPWFVIDDRLNSTFFSLYMYFIILIELAFCGWIYIEAWEKLTYDNQSVDPTYKSIFKFQGFKHSYPFVYIFIQIFKIVGFTLTFEENICLFLMVGFDGFMLFFYIIYRPYKKPQEQKQPRGYFIHNLHTIWNYLGLTGFLVLIYFRNQKIQEQVQNLSQITILCILIIYLVSIIFAILRLLHVVGLFDRCLKKIYRKVISESDISQNPLYQLKLEKEGLLKSSKKKNVSNLTSGLKTEDDQKELTEMPQRSLVLSKIKERIKDRFTEHLKQDELNNLKKSRSTRTTYKRK